MNKSKISQSDWVTQGVMVIERDMSDKQVVNDASMRVMEYLEDKVSAELYGMLQGVLLGFSDDMQLEIVKDLFEFVDGRVIGWTGCPSADMALRACYVWIADEKGLLKNGSLRKILLNNN
jgi:hypothetical protein